MHTKAMSALGHKPTFCDATAMSTLPPKVDIYRCRRRADIKVNLVCQLFDDLVGSGDKRGRHSEAKRLGDLEVDD